LINITQASSQFTQHRQCKKEKAGSIHKNALKHHPSKKKGEQPEALLMHRIHNIEQYLNQNTL